MTDFSAECSHFNSKRRLDRCIDQLIGICSGIAADGEINPTELAYLSTWLAENEEVCREFPGNLLADRIRAAMADGVFTGEEHDDLLILLRQISGNSFSETGSASADEPAIPADPSAEVIFPGMSFCFTGKFAFGTRAACEERTRLLGAVPVSSVTQELDYLVIGSGVSPNWKHETYGRKIERVLEIQGKGQSNPVILLEQQWVEAARSV